MFIYLADGGWRGCGIAHLCPVKIHQGKDNGVEAVIADVSREGIVGILFRDSTADLPVSFLLLRLGRTSSEGTAD